MRSSSRLLLALILPLALAACGDDAETTDTDTVSVDTSADTAVDDTAVDDTADTALDSTPPADTAPMYLAARDYCETVAPMFCSYYLRCGRMAVADVETCRSVFDEACNANFEPIYAREEDAGRLRLSASGVAACEDHLETVACAQQLGDLDGGCAMMWEGRVAAAGECGPGIESLVCAPGTACVLGLDFCGTCQAAAAIGEACGDDARCPSNARCLESVCVTRGLPGEACTEAQPCVIGAYCDAAVCVGYQVVGVGESCDQARRCQYKAACIGGECAETVLQGVSCTATTRCASGDCEAGVCEAAEPAAPICLDE